MYIGHEKDLPSNGVLFQTLLYMYIGHGKDLPSNNVLFQTFLYMYIIFTLAMGVGPPYISVGLQRYMYYPLRGGGFMSPGSLIVAYFGIKAHAFTPYMYNLGHKCLNMPPI